MKQEAGMAGGEEERVQYTDIIIADGRRRGY